MESLSSEAKNIALDILEDIYAAIERLEERTKDIEYYMCGPGPMSKAVVGMLGSLGVDPESIMYDNFGG